MPADSSPKGKIGGAMDLFWQALSWIAIFVVSVSYWFQVWRIHVHREVRDLSLAFYGLFLVGISLLCVQAYREDSVVFFTKQVLVIIPVIIIIIQIIYHRRDTWHDDKADSCVYCGAEQENEWHCCPHCGCAQTAVDVYRMLQSQREFTKLDPTEFSLRNNTY